MPAKNCDFSNPLVHNNPSGGKLRIFLRCFLYIIEPDGVTDRQIDGTVKRNVATFG